MTSYTDIKESSEYKNYVQSRDFSVDMIWTLYKVIPFTQQEKIMKKLISGLRFAQDAGDIECVEFIEKMMNSLHK